MNENEQKDIVNGNEDVKVGDPVLVLSDTAIINGKLYKVVERESDNINKVKEATQTVQVDKLGRIYVYKNTLKRINAGPGDWVTVIVRKEEE